MRKLTLNLEDLDVESFDATARGTRPEAGTVKARESELVTLGGYPECLDCEFSPTCPSIDPAACE